MNARAILNRCFDDIGVKGQDGVLSAFEAEDGRERLNNMVSGWRLQYGTVLAIQRTLFTLTADQQYYSIGPGGDFDVPRPVRIDGAALLLNGLNAAVTVTITRISSTATVAQTAHGLTAGDQVYVSGAVQTAYNGLQIVATTPTANSWTFTVSGSPTTPATGSISSQSVQANPIEIPTPLITQDMYQAIPLKAETSAQFTQVRYSPTQPLGQIYLWPAPTTGANQLVLYLQTVFEGFADLTTDYTFPDTPGYAEALQYNLDMRLFVPYAVSNPMVTGPLRELAYDTLALVKAANYQMADLQLDPAYTQNSHGTYVIQTDQGA